MMTENLQIIDTIEKLDALSCYLDDYELVSYDTETTGLDQDAEIIGFSLACDEENGFYIPLSSYNPKIQKLEYREKPFFEAAKSLINKLKAKKLVMHNGVFDIQKTVSNFGIDLLSSLHTDTMVLAHLINENEPVGLKDLCAKLFGEDAKQEQVEMKESITANGGQCTKKLYELYKASTDKIGKYAAKDAILTMKLFYYLVPKLYEENLQGFFYDEECMPLLKGPTYELNTVGLKIDVEKLTALKSTLENKIINLKAEILKEITPHILMEGKKAESFNINSNEQLSWLLFIILKEEFKTLTPKGKEISKSLLGKLPYTKGHKYDFIMRCQKNGIKPEKLIQADKATLQVFKNKYTWIANLLELKKEEKILNTYVTGILERVKYGVIYPSFLQTGTKGTRYSSRNPNFQNLPREDKRIKQCIIPRDNKCFIGADYSQLEPRIFTAVSQDPILLDAYRKEEDFYSAIAIPVFNKNECSADKKSPNYLGLLYPNIRQDGKVIGLSIAYGTTAPKLSFAIGLPIPMCQEIIDDYYLRLKGVANMVKIIREEVIQNGYVKNLFGRPRRIPKARIISKFKDTSFEDLKYDYRTLLNLAVNYKIQGTAGSLINRCAIAFYNECKKLNIDVKLVLQVHDELVVECDKKDADRVAKILKDKMENTVKLQGVDLIAEPKIGDNLAELK